MSLLLLLLSMTAFTVLPVGGYPFPLVWMVPLLMRVVGRSPGSQETVSGLNPSFAAMGGLLVLITAVNWGGSRVSSLIMTLGWLVFGRYCIEFVQSSHINVLIRGFKMVVLAYLLMTICCYLALWLGLNQKLISAFTFVNRLTGEVRVQAFATEPSYAAMTTFFASLVAARTGLVNAWEPKFLLLGSAMCLMYGSIYGSIFAVILIAMAIARHLANNQFRIFAGLILIMLALWLFPWHENLRIVRILKDVRWGSSDWLDSFNTVDSSGFFRVAPTVKMWADAHLFDFHLWLGHGPGAARSYFYEMFLEHIDLSQGKIGLDLGFFPAFLYDYGLVGTAFTMVWMKRVFCKALPLPLIIGFLITLFNMNINAQAFWFALLALAAVGRVIREDRAFPEGGV